jgi:hypothetical protein
MTHSGVQADELSVKPINTASLGKLTFEKSNHAAASSSCPRARKAFITDNELDVIRQHWMDPVTQDQELTISLSVEDRAGHLRNLVSDLVNRLRLPPNAKVDISLAARRYGNGQESSRSPSLIPYERIYAE